MEYRRRKLLFGETLFAVSLMLAVLPTFITRWIVYGGLFKFGAYTAYGLDLERASLVAGTFLVGPWCTDLDADSALALIGLFTAPRNARIIALYLGVGAAAFYYVIACYPYWDGMASFGNRFLISLTAVFVFGLASAVRTLGHLFS